MRSHHTHDDSLRWRVARRTLRYSDLIEASGLRKRFGEVEAVRGVDLRLNKAETFGLLGPNGAGKSTTIHMLVGALPPDAGQVTIDGGDVRDTSVRRKIGIAPQELAIYNELSAQENLAFFARIYGLRGEQLAERVDWGLRFAGLTDRAKDRVGTYSGGMKRRLNLACAAVHRPSVLLCDEPTVGVDPQSRNHIFESIETLKDEGCTLLYTTHYMEEAERLCDRVAIMDHGEILAVGGVEDLVEEHGGLARVRAELSAVPDDISTLPGPLNGSTFSVETQHPFDVIAKLGQLPITMTEMHLQQPDLERVFLQLTGRNLRD